jgi:hypothetical protein
MNAQATSFDDMEDDLDFISSNPHKELAKEKELYKESCTSCHGSGRFVGWSSYGKECFACEGRGFKEFKTSPEYRKARAAKTAANKASAARDKMVAQNAWRADHPDVIAWVNGQDGRFDFGTAMANALQQYGTLTENQVAAIRRCIARDADYKAQREEKLKAAAEVAPQVNASKLEDAFRIAKGKGLKWPKIKIAGVKISPASETSANAGALYVKEGETYLGKVFGGRFLKSRDCGAEQEGIVVNLINDPKGYAEAYGLRTGQCCICSRELTNKESIDRGIGPICAEKFGW